MTKVKTKVPTKKSNDINPVAIRSKIRDSSYLFAMFGDSVGIDCNPFLTTIAKTDGERKRLMEGRERYYNGKLKLKTK